MVYYSGKKRVTRKFKSCVRKVKRKSKKVNPYAVCMKALKVTRVKRHRKRRKK